MVSIFVGIAKIDIISSAFLNGEYLLFLKLFCMDYKRCPLLSGKNINHKLLERMYSK